MSEDQTVEYKQTWRDEYLKWICGFANAQGGVLEIGKDDRGNSVGLPDADKLLEDLPNKIRDILGIVPAVDRLTENGQDFIRITVQPYPNPINYKGQYHVRSGSTKQELKGTALDHFLLGKYGRRWDGVPLPGVKMGDLDHKLLERFRRRAVQSKRLNPEDVPADDQALIEMLRLTEGDYLKRAAVLLFHPDPERFITGAFVKIGYFLNDADLRYQDEVHGDLLSQVDETVRMLLTKYLQALISYEGIYRIETYPVPESALREAVLNAVAHKDYASCTPIQIRIYDDRILIWNSGTLPDNWTVERLKTNHPSRPFNPDVANAFFRAGMIEAWGRGIERMRADCVAQGAPEPLLRYEPGGMWVEFANRTVERGNATQKTAEKPREKTRVGPREKTPTAGNIEAQEAQVGAQEAQVELGAVEVAILRACARQPASGKELLAAAGYSSRTGHFKRGLEKLLGHELIVMTIPERPTSSLQKYRLTEKGQTVLDAVAFGGRKP